MMSIESAGLSLFIIFGAVLVIIGATRIYRNWKKGKNDKKNH